MALTLVLAVYALGVAVTGGFDMRVSGVRIRSRSWERPAALAALGAVLLLWQSRRQVGGAGERIWAEVETKGGRVLAIGAAAWAVVAAVSFGAFAVGGSDSYGYVSQARLMAHGRLTDVVPLAPEFTWPDVEATLTPLGYTRGRSPGVIAPSYPPGLAILMAPLTPWEGAVHLLVPLFGVLTIWLAYRFGVLCGDPLAGGWAAALLSVNATFMFQLFQPLGDVPTAGCWLGALVLATGPAARGSLLAARPPVPGESAIARDERLAVRSALGSGIMTALAILIRPNLAPLAVAVAAVAVRPGSTGSGRRLIAHAMPLLAGIVLLGWIQHARYGSALTSGYGSMLDYFSWSNVMPNLERYPRWITGTQTILIWLWLGAPIWIASRFANRRLAWTAWALACAVWAAYLPFVAFGEHEWMYTRFLLPAMPIMLFFCAAVVLTVIRRLPPGARAAAALAVLVALGAATFAAARAHGVFSIRHQEQRYPDAGGFVRTRLPPTTFVLAAQHSGSIRYYANRPTLRWDMLDPGRLDQVVGILRSSGYLPVLVVDAAEEVEFRERFTRGGQRAATRLAPLARFGAAGIFGFE
jgi:hypothetical protein